MKMDDRVIKLMEYLGYDNRFIKSIYFSKEIGGESGDFFEETIQITITVARGHAKDVKIDKEIDIPDLPYTYVVDEFKDEKRT